MSVPGVNEILARPVVLGKATAQLPLFPLVLVICTLHGLQLF